MRDMMDKTKKQIQYEIKSMLKTIKQLKENKGSKITIEYLEGIVKAYQEYLDNPPDSAETPQD